jgi:4'-phosphopantetheinyl transferase EntD
VNPSYSQAFVRPGAFGVLAGVHLPEGLEPVPETALAPLLPEEREHARMLAGRRQIEWAGGRLAFRLALQRLGRSSGPLSSGPSGEPLPPPGLAASITHKRDLAVALVADAGPGTLGVDLEGDGRERLAIASHVLRPEEQEILDRLPPERRWPMLMATFALKEATYKAIHLHLQRYVAFGEARVVLEPTPQVTLHLRSDEPSLTLEAHLEQMGERVLASVRCRR